MAKNESETELDLDKLREMGRRGTTVDVEKTIGIIVEESLRAFEGLNRRIHAMQSTVSRLRMRVFDGDEDVKSLEQEIDDMGGAVSTIQRQLKERGIALKTRNARVWEILMGLLKPVAGGVVALLGSWFKNKYFP